MNKIALITTYPLKDLSDMKESAMSWYSKKLLDNMPNTLRDRFLVFANKVESAESYFDENGVFIKRCWQRNSIFFLNEIVNAIKEENVKTVHLQHEFNLFGSLVTIPFVLLMFLILKLKGIELIITFHGVISQKIIKGDFNKTNQIKYPNWFLRICFFLFYFLSKNFIDKVVVHEHYFRNILCSDYFYSEDKINVIHIGIDKLDKIKDKERLKKELNIPENKKVLLFFGFLAGYKGVEMLIDAFNKLDQDEYFLLICGGKPKRVEENKEYNDWFDKINKKILKNKEIKMTGFVPETEVIKYFSAADLLIIPYLQMLSSSGPMSIGISYGLPFIVSEVFSDVWGDEVCFELNSDSLASKIEKFFGKEREEIFKILQIARNERNWSGLWLKYKLLYFN